MWTVKGREGGKSELWRKGIEHKNEGIHRKKNRVTLQSFIFNNFTVVFHWLIAPSAMLDSQHTGFD